MEAKAIRYGLLLARDMGYRRICVENDAKNMVTIFNSEDSERPTIATIYHEIKEPMGGFTSCVLCFVRREANEAAHRCAKQAIEDWRKCIWIDYIPTFLTDCIQTHCNPSFLSN
jgi:hypothetical protein